jgi:glycosyltransferase involved in cell wall biosynthesis
MLANSKPLVSVVVLTYNHSEFIADTIESILVQDYCNFEIIVSDDCSTDLTKEILKQLEELNDNVFCNFNSSNLGIVKNINMALSMCHGELIAFLGGDDLFLPGKITAQVNWFLENEKGGVCGHVTEVFDSNTKRLLYVDSPIGKRTDLDSWIKNGMVFNAQSLMVRRSFIPEFGFDERLHIVADWKFVMDLILNGAECGYVNGVYSRYRIHGSNITLLSRNIDSTKFKQSYFDQLITLSYIEAFHPRFVYACKIRRIKLGLSNILLVIKSRRFSLFFIYLKGISVSTSFYIMLSSIYKVFKRKFRV